MDLPTIGSNTCIPVDQPLVRRHDYLHDGENRRANVIHLGMVFDSRAGPSFRPAQLKPLG